MALAFLNIGTQEAILIVIVALLLFGGKKLPELARGLGRGIRDFKDASEGIKREISDQINNFEKDLDVKVDEPTKSPVSSSINEVKKEEIVVNKDEILVEDIETVTEKKFPNFTPPENTYLHNPGGHPADGTDYYKYGYSDHFAEDNVEVPSQVVPTEEELIKNKESNIKEA